MDKNKRIVLIADLFGLLALSLLDQFTKYIAIVHLKGKPPVKLVDGVLELNYLENTGAAFGMLQNQKLFFVFIAIVILGVIAYVLYKAPETPRYTLIHYTLVLIAAGAIGNTVDRLRFSYVVDFISFVLIDFPIFNMADIYVSCATAVLVFAMIFVYNEQDFNFLNFTGKKHRAIK